MDTSPLPARGTAGLDRHAILAALRHALEPDDRFLAMWEAGSAAFGRLDAWSDLDIILLVEDGATEAALMALESTLESLSPISLRHRLAQPTWHGHEQAFYRLRDTDEFLMLDVVVMRRSAGNRFLERERHGSGVISFDKTGEIAPVPVDQDDLARRIRQRLDQLRTSFPLFQPLVRKELLRGHDLDALAFYQSQTLSPLLALLRIRYCPERFDFGMRYLDRDLPTDIAMLARELWFVSGADQIGDLQRRAEDLFAATLAEIDDLEIGR
jgi:predicted nucleotidyltransferase